jgi:hypothetical protein
LQLYILIIVYIWIIIKVKKYNLTIKIYGIFNLFLIFKISLLK